MEQKKRASSGLDEVPFFLENRWAILFTNRSGSAAGIGFPRYAQLLISRDDVDHNRGSVTGNDGVGSGTALVFLII